MRSGVLGWGKLCRLEAFHLFSFIFILGELFALCSLYLYSNPFNQFLLLLVSFFLPLFLLSLYHLLILLLSVLLVPLFFKLQSVS